VTCKTLWAGVVIRLLPPNKMVAMVAVVANFVVVDRLLLGPAKEKVNRGCIKNQSCSLTVAQNSCGLPVGDWS
jgi:hypothetical protein